MISTLMAHLLMIKNLDRTIEDEESRKELHGALKDLFDNYSKGDPVFGKIFQIVQKAIVSDTEEDLLFYMLLWDNESDRVISKIQSTISRIMEIRECDTANEVDLVKKYAECQDCDGRDDCSLFDEIKKRVEHNNKNKNVN